MHVSEIGISHRTPQVPLQPVAEAEAEADWHFQALHLRRSYRVIGSSKHRTYFATRNRFDILLLFP
jgi:hypothetical protein